MSQNPSLPAPSVFALRHTSLVLNVPPVHFGLRLGASPATTGGSAREPGFWDML
ncbi:MAG: hypothetical protein ACREGH_03410 [Minisyncoccia bacterium]